jgi:hypothetical protein
MKTLPFIIASLVFASCAKYEIVGGARRSPDTLGDGQKIINEIGCVESVEGDAAVCRSADGSLLIQVKPREVWIGDVVSMTGTCDGLKIMNWSFGDGGSIQQPDPTHKYGQAGSYTVTGDCSFDQRRLRGSVTVIVKQRPGGGSILNPGLNPGQNPIQN